ncbi:MAG: GAF domain-containing protein [Desulfatibacillum sp.]|nr:GAF domain-containing protein [Desulfatibacillum sp.]
MSFFNNSKGPKLTITLAVASVFALAMGLFSTTKTSSQGYSGWTILLAMLGTALGCLAIEVSGRNFFVSGQKKDEVVFEQSRLKTLVTLSCMTDAPLEEIANFSLDEAIRLTKSEVGYLAFMNEDQTAFTMQAWSKDALKQCSMDDKPTVYNVEETGLWGEAFRQRRPIVTNDYSAPHPGKKGYPPGHVKIKRHLNLPVITGDKVVAIAGVGNKEAPYNETDVRQFTLLMQGMWRLVEKHQAKINLEKELHESERKLTTLMNNLPGMAYRCRNDSDWTMEFVSQGCLDLTGYDADEILKNQMVAYNSLIHPDEQAMVWKEVQEGVAQKTPFLVVYRLITKEGKEKWVWEKGQGIYSEDGKLVALEGFVTSITERIQALQDLRHLQSLLSNIVNSMPSILVAADENGLVTQWNLEAEKITGIASEYAEGRPIEVVLPRMADKIHMVSEAISSSNPIKQSKIPGDNPADEHYYDYTVFPLISEGHKGAVIRIDDISEQVRMDEMMIQSEKMLSLGGLAAGMAHEINNPLGGIIQNLQVVLHRLTWKSKKNLQVADESGLEMEALQKYLENRGILQLLELIADAGERAASIVENMLDFSRMNRQSSLQEVSLDALMDKTIELAANDLSLQRNSNYTNITIHKEYTPGIPTVPCEPGKIQQVLLNLIKNASQAMEINQDQGRDSSLWLRVLDEQDAVRIEVEDNGPGISEDVRAKIFEPFFTTKARGLGTGLGLSISYFIITQNHKGALEIESPPGKGAKFIIRLPKQRPADDKHQ